MLAYLALLNRRQEKARDVQNTSFQQPAKFIVQGLCDIWAKVWQSKGKSKALSDFTSVSKETFVFASKD